MSDVSTTSPGAPATGTDIVRGNGNAPGQSLGESMPSVPKDAGRASLSDFKKVLAERSQQGRQQPNARGKVAEFSRKVEARQEAASNPGQQQTKTENMGDPNQLKGLGDPRPNDGQIEVDGSTTGELVTDEAELAHAASINDQEALNKFREWEQGDMFPEELEQKLHELKANGVVRYVDTKELKQGYIRGVDYRRFHQEAINIQRAAQQRDASMQDHFQQIRDPAVMLEIYERNGYGDTLFEMAKLIGRRNREDMEHAEAAGLAMMRRKGLPEVASSWNHPDVVGAMRNAEARTKRERQLDIEARRVAFDKAQIDAQKRTQVSQAKTQEHLKVYDNQLSQLRPLVFRAYGFANNASNHQKLVQHLSAIVNQEGMPPEGITKELLMKAGQEMAEEREGERGAGETPVGLSPEQWARVQAQKKARGGGQELPAQRLGLGGGAPRGNLGGQERGSLSDLVSMVNKGRMQR